MQELPENFAAYPGETNGRDFGRHLRLSRSDFFKYYLLCCCDDTRYTLRGEISSPTGSPSMFLKEPRLRAGRTRPYDSVLDHLLAKIKVN